MSVAARLRLHVCVICSFFTFFIFSFAFYKYSCYIKLKLIVLGIFFRGESNEFHYFTVRRMHSSPACCSSSIDSIRPEKFPAPSSKFFGFSKQVSFLVWTPDFFCWSDPSERSDLSDKFKEFKIIRKELIIVEKDFCGLQQKVQNT